MVFKSFREMRKYFFPEKFELENRKNKRVLEIPEWFTKKVTKEEFIRLMDFQYGGKGVGGISPTTGGPT